MYGINILVLEHTGFEHRQLGDACGEVAHADLLGTYLRQFIYFVVEICLEFVERAVGGCVVEHGVCVFVDKGGEEQMGRLHGGAVVALSLCAGFAHHVFELV